VTPLQILAVLIGLALLALVAVVAGAFVMARQLWRSYRVNRELEQVEAEALRARQPITNSETWPWLSH
jgi:type II secretory pathway component PulJ